MLYGIRERGLKAIEYPFVSYDVEYTFARVIGKIGGFGKMDAGDLWYDHLSLVEDLDLLKAAIDIRRCDIDRIDFCIQGAKACDQKERADHTLVSCGLEKNSANAIHPTPMITAISA